MSKRIAFLGGGNMAEALLAGLQAKGGIGAQESSLPLIIEPVEARRADLMERFKVEAIAAPDERLGSVDLIILAVKPQIMERALATCRPYLDRDALILSIAAGITTKTIEALFSSELTPLMRVVRAMPNTPALVGEGATAIAAGSAASASDLDRAEAIFKSVGLVVRVTEDLLDAVTGLSGSGPAYVFQFIEALADGGVKSGLPRAEAITLAAQTVKGAAALLLKTGEHPGALKDRVTSPGGTTIAGVAALERGGLRGTVIEAVCEATKRAKELG